VFSADFNLAFLARLDFPTFAPEAGMVSPISIRHIMMPFKPYKTLYSRLAALILPEPHASHGGKCKRDTGDEDVPRKKGSERGEDGVEKVVQAGRILCQRSKTETTKFLPPPRLSQPRCLFVRLGSSEPRRLGWFPTRRHKALQTSGMVGHVGRIKIGPADLA
jgi:hypothetical protein